ncbi:MAG: zf-HC2 domain-containing protein [Burkholderiales bacterium]|nr:zf-HC2 domain-containing protein [Burkholderiales bacterium]MDE2289374.1 zf-HC2 domain-containing protein [Burkholderiales bacterium]MDE2610360.1 zf-HC2 domain-containing protein [Burkholderiales bacterium]
MKFKLTCHQAHRLVVERMDRQLGSLERVRLRAHLVICDACTIFARQMRLLRRAVRQLGQDD